VPVGLYCYIYSRHYISTNYSLEYLVKNRPCLPKGRSWWAGCFGDAACTV